MPLKKPEYQRGQKVKKHPEQRRHQTIGNPPQINPNKDRQWFVAHDNWNYLIIQPQKHQKSIPYSGDRVWIRIEVIPQRRQANSHQYPQVLQKLLLIVHITSKIWQQCVKNIIFKWVAQGWADSSWSHYSDCGVIVRNVE